RRRSGHPDVPGASVTAASQVGRGSRAAVFQPAIPQNYSSDRPLDLALHGCWGHTTQPRGQPANYRPLCPPSLSPPVEMGKVCVRLWFVRTLPSPQAAMKLKPMRPEL
ncbi:50S ribosomal protein L21, partial [Dissostichus eleginoides]